MRPPLRPAPSMTGRAQSPAESITSSGHSRPRSPSVPPNAGVKRKERDFDQDTGEETNIHVVVRCRGRSEREVRENSGVVVSTNGVRGKTVELSMGPNAISNKTYHFDKVFSPAADQAIIFDDVVSPILNEVLAGFNCTIFAYGQTGTGKTYTMSGDMTDTLGLLSDAAGIIPRVLYSLFQKLEADELECSVKCSFIELYNEELRDLLSSDDSVKLKIYDDASRKNHSATLVQGMEESHIKSATAGIKLLQQGSYRRQVAATKCNDLSSRSHTVFTITTYIKKPGETGEDYICAGKLNLVDLAGSENIQRSGAENKRAAEAGLINKSLLTLGRVINALVDKSSHIPYRESKLTRLLQDSLGGRTKTCIIATVSPAKSNLEETISSLDYAFRAKNIRNKPQVNSMISKKTLLKDFTTEIEKLKAELIATRQRNGVYLSNEQYEEITVESESRRILSEEQKARIETMEISLRNKVQELFNLTNNFHHLKRDSEAVRLVLEGSKDVLAKTEIVLRDTQQTLAEETELRKAHQQTEEALYGISRNLIGTLGNSVDDLGGLHAKLQRRSDLHDLNRDAWHSSREVVVERSSLIDTLMGSFQRDHDRLAADLAGRVQGFVDSQLKQLLSSQGLFEAGTAKYRSSENKLHAQTCEAKNNMNEVLEEIKVLRDEVKSRVGEGLQGLSTAAAKISAEVITELDEFHTQLHASYAGLGRDFKSMFDDIARQLTTQKNEVEQLRHALREALQTQVATTEDVSQQLQNCLKDERQAAQQDRRSLLAQISALIEQSAHVQEDRIQSRIESSRSQLATSLSEFQSAHQIHTKGMDQWAQQDTKLIENVSQSREELKNRMKKDWMAIDSRNTAIQTSTKTIHEETIKIVDAQLKEMASQMAALDEFVTRARSQNDEHHARHTEGVRVISHDVCSTFADAAQETEQSVSAVQTFQEESIAASKELGDSVGWTTSTILQSLDVLKSQMTNTTMSEYQPTGETPLKKDWRYATTLPRTENHESMIARLRGLPDPALASRTPSAARTPGRSPRKMASPRKPTPPSKLSSPTKGKIYTDNNDTTSTLALSSSPSKGGGLKEIDINLVPPQSRPATAQGHSHPVTTDPLNFSKSISGGCAQPPTLKRHATTGGVGETTRIPTKTGAGGGRSRVGEGRENLSQSLGPSISTSAASSTAGRRLRSSPAQ